MWFEGFPDGVRGLIYSYIRHPCAEIMRQKNLCLRYVYTRDLPMRIYDSLRPSNIGSMYYGSIKRIGLSRGERNRMRFYDRE